MDTVESAKATNFCKSNTRSATTEPLFEKKKCGHCILRLSYSFSTNLYPPRLTAHIQIWGIHDTCSALASTSDCLRISSRLHLLYLVLFIYFLFFPAVIIQDCLLTQTWSIRYTDTVSLNMSGTKQSISFWPKLIIHISMMSKQKKTTTKIRQNPIIH